MGSLGRIKYVKRQKGTRYVRAVAGDEPSRERHIAVRTYEWPLVRFAMD